MGSKSICFKGELRKILSQQICQCDFTFHTCISVFTGAKKENSKVGNRRPLWSKETQVIMIIIMVINDDHL